MNIKMIVTDLDHTLLRRDKTISKYTVDILKRIRKHGVLLAFATARDFRFVTEFITPMNNIEPDIIIADNGALARYNGNDLYKKMLPSEVVNDLIKQLEVVRCISTEDAYFLCDDSSIDHWSIGKKGLVTADFSKGIENDAFYLDGYIQSLQELTNKYPDIRAVKYSDVDLTTIVHKEATKLKALSAVASSLNIELNQIVAFGDDYSDIDMLSVCGYGVAVANAINRVKAIADYICDTNENDGVAKWLEEKFL